MNIQHSSRTDDWHTPQPILDFAHRLLGNIDLDPASSLAANARVGARQYYTAEQNGLTTDWVSGSVWLNPPGGKLKNQSLSALFWKKLMLHAQTGKLTHALFMAFSVEQLAVTQGHGVKSLGEFPLVVPERRIAFLRPDGTPGVAPSHSNCIAYIPGTVDKTARFFELFGEIGVCINK